jgi:hypothetical protein
MGMGSAGGQRRRGAHVVVVLVVLQVCLDLRLGVDLLLQRLVDGLVELRREQGRDAARPRSAPRPRDGAGGRGGRRQLPRTCSMSLTASSSLILFSTSISSSTSISDTQMSARRHSSYTMAAADAAAAPALRRVDRGGGGEAAAVPGRFDARRGGGGGRVARRGGAGRWRARVVSRCWGLCLRRAAPAPTAARLPRSERRAGSKPHSSRPRSRAPFAPITRSQRKPPCWPPSRPQQLGRRAIATRLARARLLGLRLRKAPAARPGRAPDRPPPAAAPANCGRPRASSRGAAIGAAPTSTPSHAPPGRARWTRRPAARRWGRAAGPPQQHHSARQPCR